MTLRFWKMSGAGNDFVLLEGSPSRRAPALARALCDRRRGVGADGLLLVSRRGLSLRYYNADGSEAFCGNGSRCAAWWMHAQGWTGKRREFSFSTSRGALRARILCHGRAAVAMPAPKLLRQATVTAAGRAWKTQLWDAGVPHAVVVVPDLEAAPVMEAGRALRFHRVFGRGGANVDFIAKRRGGLAMRTYERGVEAETLACGTGALACAAAAERFAWTKSPVRVAVRGGDTLTVRFESEKAGAARAWLEGPAEICFTGAVKR